MKTRSLCILALLGFAFSRPALAQVVVPGTPGATTTGVPTTTGAPIGGTPGTPIIGGTDRSAGLPTGVPTGTVPLNATTPIGATGTGQPIYPNGVPARNLDGGTQRADQPRTNGRPAVSGSQPTKSLFKKRGSTSSPRL